MKRYNNAQFLVSSILIIFLLLPTFLQAQPGFGDDVEDVPIDGGISLLVAAGVGYGAKRIREKKANKEKLGL